MAFGFIITFFMGCHGEPQEGPEGCSLQPVCQGNTVVVCTPDAEGKVKLTETPCGDERCAADAPTPQCVPATALPCEPGSPPIGCQNGQVIACNPEAGYLRPQACGPGEFCVEAQDAPYCVAAEGQTCIQGRWITLCVAGERFECDSMGKVIVVAGECP